MNIGIDIDGVLTNIAEYQLEYGSKYTNNINLNLLNINPAEYETSDIFVWNEEQDKVFWDTYMEQYAKEERIRKFAPEVIEKLNEKHNIYIITARENYSNVDIKKITEQWLKENNVKYNELIFAGDKLPVILDKKIDVMVEDYPKNINKLKDHCNVVVFDNIYNKDAEGKFRAYSWYQIFEYIENLENGN